jgi:hypothetical protein
MNSTVIVALFTGPGCSNCVPKYKIIDAFDDPYKGSKVSLNSITGNMEIETKAGFA